MRSRILIAMVAVVVGGCAPPGARSPTGASGPSRLEQQLIHVDTIVAGERVYREPEVDKPPVPVFTRTSGPKYPTQLKSQGVQGRVEFRFVIDTTGAVNMSTAQPVSFTRVEFALAVREFLPQQRFEPAQHGGRRVAVWTVMAFEFRLGP